jgi:glycosyltransferase involved in cell wall biosynthesis
MADRTVDKRTEALIVSTGIGIGGAEQVVVNLTRGMVECGRPVRTIFPAALDDATKAWLAQTELPIETHPAALHINEGRNRATMRRFSALLAESTAPAVSLHYGGNYVLLRDVLAVRAAGKAAVASVHHPAGWVEMGWRKRAQTCLCGMLLQAVVVPTVLMRGIMEQAGVPRRKLAVVPYGISEPRTRPSREDARRRLCLPSHAFVVSTVARLVPSKGIGDLIEAISLLGAPDCVLLVAGTGPCRQELESLAAGRPTVQVRFLGSVPDTDDLYAASDVFVLPSYMEGFGLVYVEAAMHGVPSIGTRVGGVPEAIEGGATGLLVAPRAPAELAAALAALRRDPVKLAEMGAAANRRAHAKFTAKRMAEAYQRILFPGS